MPRAVDMAERFRATALRNKDKADLATQEPPITETSEKPHQRERPIRYTLDLNPAQHRALKVFAFNAEVDASSVVRALLSELERDTALAARVLGQVKGPKNGAF